MKVPFLTVATVAAGLLVLLALFAEESTSGQTVSTAHIIDFPVMAAQIGGDAAIQPNDETSQSEFGMSSAAVSASADTRRPPQAMIWAPKSIIPKPTGEIAEQAELALKESKTLMADLTLDQLAGYLSEQTGSPARLDERAIAIAKIDAATTPLQIQSESLPLRAALHQLLHPLGLQVVVREEGLVITADPAAQVRNGVNDSRWINVDEDAEEKIAAALMQPTTVNFVEEPLENALAILADQHKLPIDIDRRSLEEVGLSADTPVTVSLENVKLESVLAAIADENDLTFTVRHERLVVLTREADEAQPLIRIYWLEGIGLPPEAYDELMSLIQTTIQCDTWEALGGPSTMSPMNQGVRPALVVSTTYEVHREIDTFLSRLRDAHFGPDPVTQPTLVPAPPAQSQQNASGGMSGGMGGMGGGMGGGVGGGGGMF